jgi:very-short-patch-repair endonuclease
MPIELSPDCRELIELQSGVISRQQAILGGMSPDVIDGLLRSRRWQCLQRGSYAVFTGEPPREAVLWAVLHRAGPGAALSHQTAAEMFGLIDHPSSLIHVTVPASRRVTRIPGAVIHRSTRVPQTRHPCLLPPRTRIDETVLDLVHQAATFDAAFNWACGACQRWLTTADKLGFAMARRSRMRWRAELSVALADIRDGVHSALEHRYVHHVEQPHGLPRAKRQVKTIRGMRTGYLDNLYKQYRMCVELDGRAAHPDDRRWQDIHRDNAAAAGGVATLRYNWADVAERPCLMAWQIAMTLRQRGWPGRMRPCGPRCRQASPMILET